MNRKIFVLLFVAAVLVQFLGMFMIDLMEHDATQYATISMQMIRDGSWLQIYWRDVSYLDKPPLVFWASSVSYLLFGVNHFAYRLPSYLVLLLGVYSTYRLSKNIHDRQTAMLSSLVLLTTQGVFLISHDVRTDTMLLGWVIFSLWQLSEYIERKKTMNFFLAFTGIGLAMLTKGPIGLMIPVLAFGPQLLLQRRWRDIFNPLWLAGIAWVGMLLAPMLIGLWQQHGPTGIEFFFWKQSFGRITGENVWRDESGPLFFVHSFAWSFLPWTLPAVYGVYIKIRSLIQKPDANDSFVLWGALTVFVAMSLATYKLPHYIFVVFPLFAMMAATGIQEIIRLRMRVWIWLQWLANSLILAGMVFLAIADFSWLYVAILLVTAIVLCALFFQTNCRHNFGTSVVVVFGFVIIIHANAMLNLGFYPKLLGYQSGGVAGRDVRESGVPEDAVCFFAQHSPSFDFYSQTTATYYRTLPQLDSALDSQQWLTVYTNEQGMNMLREHGYTIQSEQAYQEFKATKLSLQYLFPASRDNVTATNYVVKVGLRSTKVQTEE
jgi:4-amino-4-deoxy-L-arabinose transferase-like glycosyltransferase